jgi:hypothetical protein
MAASKVRRRTRARGSIDILPSGALRVRLYAGQDPLTKKRHVLVETIPAGPEAQKQAEAALDRMHLEVSERRSPRTNATVDQLLERYLDQFSGGENTLELYRGHVRNHISPLLGPLKVGQLTPETLDSFYAELRRCRTHCTSKRRTIDHRVKGDHECDERCRPHECRPLAATTIRHIHFILSGAYKRALRWRWVSVSPLNARATLFTAQKALPLMRDGGSIVLVGSIAGYKGIDGGDGSAVWTAACGQSPGQTWTYTAGELRQTRLGTSCRVDAGTLCRFVRVDA